MGTSLLCDRKRRRLEQCGHSNACQKLLTMISRGRLSIDGAVDLANCMVEDGMVSSAIDSFASLGTNSKHPSNCERDFHCWLRDLFNFRLQPYTLFMNLQDSRLKFVFSLFWLYVHHQLVPKLPSLLPSPILTTIFTITVFKIITTIFSLSPSASSPSCAMVAQPPYPGRWFHAETMCGQMPLAT